MTMIYAHRGASGYAPENTLEAFELAAKMGAAGVELDVHFCKSGEVVVAHDEKVDRVSDGEGYIKDMTLKELKALHFNRIHPEYQNARIPTLEEVYALLKPAGLLVNVELKTGSIDYTGIEQACVDIATRMGMTQKVLYSSFNHRSLGIVKNIDASLPCGILYDTVMFKPWEYAAQNGMNALHTRLSELRFPDVVPTAHKANLEVNPWTVNTPEDIRMCIAAGADRIISNYPDRALEILKNG